MSTSAVIFDIDGTLADVSHLEEYVLGHNTDYEKFHELAMAAEPIAWVSNILWDYGDACVQRVLVTARQEKYRESTEDWLEKHGIVYDELWMRITGDIRPDYEVKAEILAQLQGAYDIGHAYDDNPETVKLWLQHGIPTTVVPGHPGGWR